MYSCHKPCFFRFLIFMFPFFTFTKLGRNVTFFYRWAFPQATGLGPWLGLFWTALSPYPPFCWLQWLLLKVPPAAGGVGLGWWYIKKNIYHIYIYIYFPREGDVSVLMDGWCFGAIQGVWFTEKKVNGNHGQRDGECWDPRWLGEIGRYWRVIRYCEAFGFLDFLAFREAMPVHGPKRSQKFQPTSLREFL